MTFVIVLGVCAVVIGLVWLLFAPRRHPEARVAREDVTDDPHLR